MKRGGWLIVLFLLSVRGAAYAGTVPDAAGARQRDEIESLQERILKSHGQTYGEIKEMTGLIAAANVKLKQDLPALGKLLASLELTSEEDRCEKLASLRERVGMIEKNVDEIRAMIAVGEEKLGRRQAPALEDVEALMKEFSRICRWHAENTRILESLIYENPRTERSR